MDGRRFDTPQLTHADEFPASGRTPNTEPQMNHDGGDYLVRYDGDYLSWSPKDKFEAGYTEI